MESRVRVGQLRSQPSVEGAPVTGQKWGYVLVLLRGWWMALTDIEIRGTRPGEKPFKLYNREGYSCWLILSGLGWALVVSF